MLNDSVLWDYYKIIFIVIIYNYSYLNLINDVNEVNILKLRILKEVEYINGDCMFY